MNILIVCIQGMTSNVLATKLNELSILKKDSYKFKSINYSEVKKELDWADIVFLTPQIKNVVNQIKEKAEGKNCEVWILMDTSISFNNIPRTYDNLTKSIEQNQREAIKIKDFLFSYVRDLVFFVFVVLVVGYFFKLLFIITDTILFYEVFEKTVGIISIYTILAMGYLYAVYVKEHRLPYMIASIATIFILSPFSLNEFITFATFSISRSYLEIQSYGISWLPFYCSIFLIVLPLFQFISKQFQEILKKRNRMVSSNNMIVASFTAAFLVSMLLVVRVLLRAIT